MEARGVVGGGELEPERDISYGSVVERVAKRNIPHVRRPHVNSTVLANPEARITEVTARIPNNPNEGGLAAETQVTATRPHAQGVIEEGR